MTMRRKIAAGLGGLTLMLGTLGGAAAVGAATNHPVTPAAAVQSGQSDGETADGPDATDGQDAQDASGAQDVPEAGDTPDATTTTTGQDTDNVQDGSGQEVEDSPTDMPVTTTP